jgi:hypothetical protein
MIETVGSENMVLCSDITDVFSGKLFYLKNPPPPRLKKLHFYNK